MPAAANERCRWRGDRDHRWRAGRTTSWSPTGSTPEAKKILIGLCLLEAADLDAAISWAARFLLRGTAESCHA
jgi:hypothetical protein